MTEPIVFLTHEEVCTLTGAGTKAGQITVLKQNGIRHTIKRNGWPCVLASAISGAVTAPEPTNKSWAPRKAG